MVYLYLLCSFFWILLRGVEVDSDDEFLSMQSVLAVLGMCLIGVLCRALNCVDDNTRFQAFACVNAHTTEGASEESSEESHSESDSDAVHIVVPSTVRIRNPAAVAIIREYVAGHGWGGMYEIFLTRCLHVADMDRGFTAIAECRERKTEDDGDNAE